MLKKTEPLPVYSSFFIFKIFRKKGLYDYDFHRELINSFLKYLCLLNTFSWIGSILKYKRYKIFMIYEFLDSIITVGS